MCFQIATYGNDDLILHTSKRKKKKASNKTKVATNFLETYDFSV